MMKKDGKKANVLAVTSGKGGVGKTSVAANLAICLLAAGKDVVLIDADMGLANIDVVLNMRPRHTLADVMLDGYALKDVIHAGPAGLRVICGASGLTSMTELNEFQRKRVMQDLAELEQQADMIVVDTGAGISRDVLCFCEAADHTIVVTTPEPAAMTDAYAMIKCLSQAHTGVRISLLVNMAESRNDAKKVFQRLAGTAQKFLSVVVYDAGYILRDEHLADAVRQREPVVLAHSRCQASYCLLALASKLGRAGEASMRQEGFFRKVVNWFF